MVAPQIRLLRYYEDDEAIECAAVYAHAHEVVSLAACPYDPALVASVYNVVPGMRASVWRMPGLPGSGGDDGDAARSPAEEMSGAPPKDLVRVADLGGGGEGGSNSGSRHLHVQWFPAREAANSARLISVSESTARIWDLGGGASSGPQPTASASINTGDASFIGAVAWDPHHANEVAIAADSSIRCWDVRSGERLRSVEAATPPGACVRSLSYNPNKPWHLASAGDDFRVKLWDLRRLGKPLKILDGHTHW